MRKFWRRLLITLIILLLLAAGAIYFFPIQDIATQQIKTVLEARGIKVSSINLQHLDSKQAIISDLKIGGDPSLDIGELHATYAPREVIKGKLQTVNISDMIVNAYIKDDHWVVGGLEEFMKPKAEAAPQTAIDFPFISSTLPAIITIKKAIINAQDNDLKIVVPLDIDITNNNGTISGKIASDKLVATGLPYEIPPLTVSGDYSLNGEQLQLNLNGQSAKKDYILKLALTAPNNNVMDGTVVIDQIRFPWGGGQVSTKSVTVPLDMKKPIKLTLDLKNIELETLLGSVSGGKITGNGKVTGSLPITYHPDGTITLQKGAAHANDNGVLVVSPDLLPGDNQQLATARETLENFHYTTLKIAVSSNQQQESVIQLVVEGRNPDANNGRPVKLNVNLSGDIIPLIQQSLLAINDLKQLLHIEEK